MILLPTSLTGVELSSLFGSTDTDPWVSYNDRCKDHHLPFSPIDGSSVDNYVE